MTDQQQTEKPSKPFTGWPKNYYTEKLIPIAQARGVVREGSVKAECDRAGRVRWFINGNRCSRKDAESSLRADAEAVHE